MKPTLLLIIFFISPSFLARSETSCPPADGPRRLVIIKGKATIVNFPGGPLPATSETLIFQKVGCESCFIGANVSGDGSYKILVGDGKYKIIVRNPSSPEVDWLAPDQPRFIDTEAEPNLSSVFNFDIKIKMPN